MTTPEPNGGVLTWVVRGVLALAALSAPILVYRGFTESDTADPVKKQRLGEASQRPIAPESTTEPKP